MCGSSSWASNDPFYSLFHCALFGVVGLKSSHRSIVKIEILYSQKRNFPFPCLFHRKIPFHFCFRFRVKNSISLPFYKFSFPFPYFPSISTFPSEKPKVSTPFSSLVTSLYYYLYSGELCVVTCNTSFIRL